MAFAVGHISGAFQPGGHLRPVGRRPFSGKEVIGYIIAQVVGGIIAAAVLYVVASGKAGFDAAASGFASTAMANTPRAASMLSAIVIEIVLTCGFLLVIHGATDKHAPAALPHRHRPGADLIHLISIPVTNTSVNPARRQFSRRLGAAAAVAVLGHANRRWILGGVLYRTLLENAINAFQSPGLRAFLATALLGPVIWVVSWALFSSCKGCIVHVFGTLYYSVAAGRRLFTASSSLLRAKADKPHAQLDCLCNPFYGISRRSSTIWPATCWQYCITPR